MTLAARFEEGAPLESLLAVRLWLINYARPWLSGLKCRSQGHFMSV